MTDNLDQVIYKYRSINNADELQRVIDIIELNNLWFANPIELNDPFDCNPIMSVSEDPEERKVELEDFLNSSPTELKRILNSDRRKVESELYDEKNLQKLVLQTISSGISICSMSCIPDNPLMWSHYSSGHTGVCLGFWRYRVDDIFRYSLSVKYSKNRPKLNHLKLRREFENPDIKQEYIDKSILTKSDDWKYEDEVRVISHGPRGTRKFNSLSLNCVILGMRINNEHERLIVEASKKYKPKTKIMRAHLHGTQYRLIVE